MKVKKLKRKLIRLLRREDVRGALEPLLLIGAIYFSLSGVIMLALRTDQPMMGVISDSMKHDGEGRLWRNHFLDRGIDPAGFPIQGGFERGDMLIIQGIGSPGDVEVGDVIVYEAEPLPITHRVAHVRIEGGGAWYVTKGDANDWLDNDIGFSPAEGVEPGQVIGEVVLVIPKLGYVTLYPWVFGIIIILLFFAVWMIRRD